MTNYPHCLVSGDAVSGPVGGALFFGALPIVLTLDPRCLNQPQQARRFIVLNTLEIFRNQRKRKRPIINCSRGAIVAR